MEARVIARRALALSVLFVTLVAAPLAAAPPAPSATPSGASIAAQRFDVLAAQAKATMLADPAAALAQARHAEQVARSFADRAERTTDIATAQWLEGEAYLRLADSAHAAPIIERAIAAIKDQRPLTKLHGDLLLSRGRLHSLKADVVTALADYQAAHQIFHGIGDTRSRAIALLSIASLYGNAKNYEGALKYYGQALDVYRGDPALSVSIYNNRGNALKELKRYGDAARQFGNALPIARKMHSPLLVAVILGNIAKVDLAQQKLDAADRMIAEGFAVASQGDAAGFRPQLLAMAAQSALQHGNVEHAGRLIEQSFAGVDLATTPLASRDAHQTAYLVFRELGDSQRALSHLAALKRLDDDSTALATSTNTALMAARFDSANQELRIAKLKGDESQRSLELEQERAHFQQILFAGISVATLIGLGMLAFGYAQIRRSRDQVRAANVDLAASNVALEKALAAKTEFLATTSHEIRTPLNGILGMTQVMLADRALAEPLRDRIGIVHEAGLTMRTLVDDILDVAKMETGNLIVECVVVDVAATLRDGTRLWEEQARAKRLGFVLDLSEAPSHVLGDAARLRQIVFNLLSNAVKFTAAGSVGVRVWTHSEDGDDRLRIAVSDSGIGIPADKHAEIFESFKQADGGTTRQFGGTGLGLTIVRNLARAMDGSVSVDSVAGAGATFTVDVPLRIAEAPELPAEADGAGGAGGLLIVDRNPIARAMLRAVLEARAGAVRFAGSLDEARAALAEHPLSIVLIDEATAKAAGDAMPDELTALADAARSVGAVTAMLWADPDRSAIAGAGLDRIIAKPIAGPALADALYSPQKSQATDNCALVTRAA